MPRSSARPLRVLVVTMGKRTAAVIRNELDQQLGSLLHFEYLSLEDDLEVMLHADLVVVSSIFVVDRIARRIMPGTHLLVLRRTLSPVGWKQVRDIPENTKVLVVNDTRNSCVETVSLLYELGAKHLELIPWFPGMDSVPQVHMVLTPNEVALNPLPHVPCVNVGDRVLDPGSLFEMLSQLDLLNADTVPLVLRQIERSVPRNPGMLRMLCSFNPHNQVFLSLLDALHDGVVLFDPQDILLLANKSATHLARELGLEIPGARVKDVLSRTGVWHEGHRLPQQEYLTVGGRLYSLHCHLFGETGSMYKGVLLLRQHTEGLGTKPETGKRLEHGHIAKYSLENLVGHSACLLAAKDRAVRFAHSEAAVLIEGESGTGKELFAHGIHKNSPRQHQPFIAFNCAAVPDTLIESELFGYEDGAYTGARKGGRPGLFELAHSGTLFLDEIGDISPSMQAKLLRVIQEQEVVRVGGRTVTPVNVRLLCATNKNLALLVRRGIFRSDLYYRLNVLLLRVPPLRQRKNDIPLLLSHFFQRQGLKRDIPCAVMDRLLDYTWPGNVRELENCVAHMTSMGQGQASYTVQDLPEHLVHGTPFDEADPPPTRPHSLKSPDPDPLPPDLAALVEIIGRLNRLGIRPGRQRLSVELQAGGWKLSPGAVRTRLAALQQAGRISTGAGRHGCLLLNAP